MAENEGKGAPAEATETAPAEGAEAAAGEAAAGEGAAASQEGLAKEIDDALTKADEAINSRSLMSKLFQKEVALENGVKELKFAPGKTAAVGIGAVGGLWLLSKMMGGGKKDTWQDQVASSSSMESGAGIA